jgi:uncharacterized protein involved in exopolysaccharide biosynthesis
VRVNGSQDWSLWIDPQPETQRNDLTLVPYLQLFWERRRSLLRAALYSLLASLALALLCPSRYESITRLMPPDSSQSGVGLGLLSMLARRGSSGSAAMGSVGGLAGDLLGIKSTGELFVGILGSQTVQDRPIDKFHLQRVYWDSKIEDARKDLATHTDVTEDRKTGIITIGVTDRDPKRAAAMARAYVDELDRLVAQVSTSSARREHIFLEGRLEKVKSDLDSAAKNFSAFASKNTAIDIPAQGKAMVEAAALLQGQLVAAQLQLSGLRQIYSDSNTRVRAAEAQVNELQKKLNEIGGAGTPNDVKNENSLFPSIRKLPLLGVTYADLYRQTRIQETVYELLTQQYELAKVQEAKEIPTVKVLDPALVPTKRSFPPRTALAVLGTMLGIAAAMTWIVGEARWTAVGERDPRKVFAANVFATVQARLPMRWRNGGAAVEGNGHRPWSSRGEPGADREGNDYGSQ